MACKRFGNEFILNSIKELYNGTIEILNPPEQQLYNDTKLFCKCKIDGCEWTTNFNQLKSNHRCPACAMLNNILTGELTRARKVTYEIFNIVLNKIKIDDIELITPKEEFIYNSKNKMRFKCNKHNKEWEITAISILKRPYCPHCEKERTIKQNGIDFINKIHTKWPEIDFAEEYKGYDASMKFINNNTGETFIQQPQTLLRNFKENGIKEYKKRIIKKDCVSKTKYKTSYPLLELYPQLENLIKDKEELKGVLVKDNKPITLMCPRCGVEKTIKTKNLNMFLKKPFACNYCSIGISYPNRFIKELLDELNNTVYKDNPINYKREYQPIWAKPYKYDIYFNLNNIDYYLELDGSQHFSPKFFTTKLKREGKEAEDLFNKVKEHDRIKNELVKQNNGVIIRINCEDVDSMKENILNSELSKILKLNNTDWKNVSEKSQEDIVLKIWELYNNGKGNSVKEISGILKISQSAIVRYLKRGREIGMVMETVEESHLKALRKADEKNRKPIKVINLSKSKTNEVMYFPSGASFAQYLIDNDKNFKNKKRNIVGASINSACRHYRKFHNYKVSYLSQEELKKVKDKIIDYQLEKGIYNKK